jgi:hypothetical protein
MKRRFVFKSAAFGIEFRKPLHSSILDLKQMTKGGHLERESTAVFREYHLFVRACWRRILNVPAG